MNKPRESASRIALGTAQFGLPYGIANRDGQVGRATAGAMLQLAAESRIDTIDTAIAYGNSESCLGEIGTRGFKVVTKLPALPDSCIDIDGWIHEQVAASLNRLKLGAVYGVLLHRPSQLLETRGKTIYRSLQEIKEAGKARKVGISIYAPSELEELTPRYRFDLVQAPLNLVDRRMQATGWLRRLKDEGVEIHTRSAFLQGLLLMPQATIPAAFSTWSKLWRTWHDWLAGTSVSAVQACLAFPLAYPEVERVVVGADNVRQLEQITRPAAGLSPAELPDLQCNSEELINPTMWCRR